MLIPTFHFLIRKLSLSHSHLSLQKPLSKCCHFLVMQDLEATYCSMLQRCAKSSNLHQGRAIHSLFIKQSLLSSFYPYNHLLNMYVKCGDLVRGLQLFDEMPERNVVSWTAVLAGFVQHGRPKEALSLFSRMHFSQTKPNEFTFVSVLQACSFSETLYHAYQIYALVIKFGFVSNIFLVNALLTVLVRHSKLAEASDLFEKCPNKDIVSWNAMMSGYLQYSPDKIPDFWSRMNSEGVKPDNFTFTNILTGVAALSDIKLGLQVHARLVKSGHGSEMCVGNSLVDFYLKHQQLCSGFKVFDEMLARDVHIWTQMATGCLTCGDPRRSLKLIQEMRSFGIKPNKFTIVTAFNACSNLASLEEGKKVHSLRLKLGDEMDVCADNALLDMYSKCGFMEGALKVFESMEDRNVVSWTTMIMGYAQNGQSKQALDIFDQMKINGVDPNYITLICVFYACSQGGFIEEGRKYFSIMEGEFGISPGQDHYACMVMLLGRAGHTKEAENLILTMPFKPGMLIWKTLLGACQNHGDIETAKNAAQHALNLDENDPSTYVLLSNLLAGSSDWDEVGILRNVMESKDVKKLPGSSWIQITG